MWLAVRDLTKLRNQPLLQVFILSGIQCSRTEALSEDAVIQIVHEIENFGLLR